MPGSDFMDTKQVPHGAVAAVTYYSTALKRFRRMHVYTPPGYETGTAEYPVFYLLHGAGDCDDSWWTVGRAGFILDNLIAAKKAKPMIVVMPAGHTGPFSFGPGAPRPPVDEFRTTSRPTSCPTSRRHYRVLTDRPSRAIAGLSMGGAQTLNIAIPRPRQVRLHRRFQLGRLRHHRRRRRCRSRRAPASRSSTRRRSTTPELKKGLKLVWFATGKDDFLIETTRATVEMLKKHGFDVGLQGNRRRPHLDQLAQLPERVRPAALPLISLTCASWSSVVR